MPYLKKVVKNGNDYYYLFHTVREGSKFLKYSKYLGKEEPCNLENAKKEFLREVLDNKQEPDNNVIEELQKIQEEHGYLPEENLKELVRRGIPGTDIYGVATFYSQFSFQKPAKHVISVCDGTACHVRGSKDLLDALQKILDIEEGQTTEDGLFSLDVVRCLGLCASAPLIKIDEEVYAKIAPEQIEGILNKYRQEE